MTDVMNILAIDQGTSSTKALVVDEHGVVLSEASVDVTPTTRGHDEVEHDANALLASIVTAGRQALALASVDVAAVGLANQGETVVAWDPLTGEACSPAIVWQDRRATVVTDQLASHASRLFELTGLPLDPYFTAPKLRWLADRAPEGAIVGGIDAWLNLQLCGQIITDAATASRSGLLDLDRRQWSSEVVGLYGLDETQLPQVVDCAGRLGTTSVFGPELPLTALCVDQQAALVGENCLRSGEAKCTYGTGAFLLVATGTLAARSRHGLSSSVAYQFSNEAGYCLDGQVYTAGSAIQWLIKLGLLESASQLDDLVTQALPSATPVCVPAFAGLGAPQWEPRGTAHFEGITLSTHAPELVASVVEGIAAQVAFLVQGAEADLGTPLSILRVDGGLTHSATLMQMQADLLQIPVEVFPSPDATALGIAALARHGLHPETTFEPFRLGRTRLYEPRMSESEANSRLDRFTAAAQRVVAAATGER